MRYRILNDLFFYNTDLIASTVSMFVACLMHWSVCLSSHPVLHTQSFCSFNRCAKTILIKLNLVPYRSEMIAIHNSSIVTYNDNWGHLLPVQCRDYLKPMAMWPLQFNE